MPWFLLLWLLLLIRSLFATITSFLASAGSGLAWSSSLVMAAGSEYVDSYERDSLLACLSNDAEMDLFSSVASLGSRITAFDSRGSTSGSLLTFGLRNWKSFRF